MWSMETHHRHIAFIQPIQITHRTAHVHLEVKITGVIHVICHAQLEAAYRSRSICICRRIWISVNALNHHRNERAISRVVPKLGNRIACIIQNDVIVIGDGRRSQCDVATCSFTKHGDFVTRNSPRVAVFSNGLAEETNRCAAILNSTVRRLD